MLHLAHFLRLLDYLAFDLQTQGQSHLLAIHLLYHVGLKVLERRDGLLQSHLDYRQERHDV